MQDAQPYPVVIIDEIETLLDKFISDFLDKDGHKHAIWEAFKELLSKAEKVIFLDAFITTKTIRFVEYFSQSYKIFERLDEPMTRTISYVTNQEMMLADIVEKLNAGKKLFIFYPFKRDSPSFHAMERVNAAIVERTGKRGDIYHADVDDSAKRGLKDVYGTWQDLNYVITNNIITSGVNYDNEKYPFDYKYLFIPRTTRLEISFKCRIVRDI
jgi:hypothetical protein